MIYRIIFCFLFSPLLFAAAKEDSAKGLDTLMTPEAQKATGVYRLTSRQKKALEEWLIQWSDTLHKEDAQRASSGDQDSSQDQTQKEDGDTVQSVLDTGHFVRLHNGDVWSVNPNNWIYVYYWKAGDKISVKKSQDFLFPYTLTNETQGQSVTAKKPSADQAGAFKTTYTITKVKDDGQFITLSDGSVWQVQSSLRYMTSSWDKGEPVFVVQNNNSTLQPTMLYNGKYSRSVGVSLVKKGSAKKEEKSEKKQLKKNEKDGNQNSPQTPPSANSLRSTSQRAGAAATTRRPS